MSKEDAEKIRLGNEVVRMIQSLRSTAGSDTGYSRRNITFPGGAVCLFIVNDSKLADLFDAAAERGYEVLTVTPPTERN